MAPPIGLASPSRTSSPACSPRRACCWRCWRGEQTGRGTACRRRDARLGGGAAHVSGRDRLCHRRVAGTVGQSAPLHRAVRHVRDRGRPAGAGRRQRRPVGTLLRRGTRTRRAAGGPRFATNAGRVRHYDALEPRSARRCWPIPARGWTTRLVAAGVPCGPVRTVDEALPDAQLAARGMIERLAHANGRRHLGAGRAHQAVGDARGACVRPRRRWASTPTRCSGRSGSPTARSRG